MKKTFELSEKDFQEEFLSIFAIGLLECLKVNLIDTDRAEQWLFSPVISYSVDEKDFSKQFIFAMQYASELDACKNSEYFQKSISETFQLFYETLKNNIDHSEKISPKKPLLTIC